MIADPFTKVLRTRLSKSDIHSYGKNIFHSRKKEKNMISGDER